MYRVNEYKGDDSNGLLKSGAVVKYYSESEASEFIVGRDGYVSGINW